MGRLLFDQYPDLEGRDFQPSEVGLLSGVSPEKQRAYRHKGFTRPFLKEWEGTARHNYSWLDVSRWALLADAQQCGFDLASAGYFAGAFAKVDGQPRPFGDENATLGQVLTYDRRPSTERPDLYLVCTPTIGKPETFVNVTTWSSTDHQGVLSSRFGFWMNFSDFQRRLLLRFEALH
jgi:hypothetical protein